MNVTHNCTRLIEISQEDAELHADRLTSAERFDNGSSVVYSGVHPEHGKVFIFIPPIGSSFLLLPFEPLVFSS